MAESFRVELQGIDALRLKMQGLSSEEAKKAFRSALRRAAKVIADQAKANAAALNDPGTGRAISDNVAVRPSSYYEKRTGDLMMRVGVLGGAVLPEGDPDTNAGAPTPHWRLLEFGTSKMAARPFLRPAMNNSASEVFDVFVVEASKAVDRALKRAATKR